MKYLETSVETRTLHSNSEKRSNLSTYTLHNAADNTRADVSQGKKNISIHETDVDDTFLQLYAKTFNTLVLIARSLKLSGVS